MKSIKIGPEARNYFYDLLLTQNLRLRFILLSCDYGLYSIPNKIDNHLQRVDFDSDFVCAKFAQFILFSSKMHYNF